MRTISKTIKGINIEIGASTSGLDKVLSDVNKSSRDIGKELSQVNKLLKFNPKDTVLLEQKQKLLGDQVGTTKEKLDKLKDAEKQVQEQFQKGEISEEQYRAFQREIVATGSRLEHYKQQLESVSDTKVSFSDKMSQASEKLKDVGGKITDVGAGLTKKLTGPLVAAGTGLFAMAKASGNAADRLLDLRDITGLTTDSIQEWQHVATVAGVSTETMTGAVEGLVKKIPQLEAEGGKATEAINKLGFSYEDLKNASPDEQMDMMINALSEMDDPLERNAMGAQLFGGAWKDLAPIMGMGADEIAKTRDEAHELGRVMSEESLQDANNFRIEMDKLTGTLKSAALQAGADLAPMLSEKLGPVIQDTIVPGIQAFSEKIGELVTWFGDLDPKMQDNILKAIALAAAIGPILVVGGKLATGIGSIIGVATKLAPLAKGIALAVGGITAPVALTVAGIAALIAIGVALWKNWDVIKEKAGALGKAMGEKWDGIKKSTSESWGNVRDSISNSLNKASEITTKMTGKVKDTIDKNGGGIKGIIKTGVDGYTSLWQGGFNLMDKITGEKFTNIFKAVNDNIGKARDAVKTGIDKMVGFLKFEWSLPKLKMPSFNIDGKFSLNPPSVPKFNIQWNAAGAIFTKPYVFGNQGFGEAGPEAILPISKLAGMMADTMAQMGITNNYGGDIIVKNMIVRNDNDIKKIAIELDNLRRNTNRGRGIR